MAERVGFARLPAGGQPAREMSPTCAALIAERNPVDNPDAETLQQNGGEGGIRRLPRGRPARQGNVPNVRGAHSGAQSHRQSRCRDAPAEWRRGWDSTVAPRAASPPGKCPQHTRTVDAKRSGRMAERVGFANGCPAGGSARQGNVPNTREPWMRNAPAEWRRGWDSTVAQRAVSPRNQCPQRARRSWRSAIPSTIPMPRRSGRMAERVGFEPTVEFPQHTLSKRAP